MKPSKGAGAWLAIYNDPQQEVVRRLRDTILHADARIKETIRGDAPTFSYRGTLASIVLEGKKRVSLLVERGAELPGHHPRLEGSGDTVRVMTIHDVAEAQAARYDLKHLFRSWCDWRDAGAAESDERKARAARKPAAKKTAPPKKAARQAAEKARLRKKAARPAAKRARPRKRAARPAAKSAAKKVSSRTRAVRPAAKRARKRSARGSR